MVNVPTLSPALWHVSLAGSSYVLSKDKKLMSSSLRCLTPNPDISGIGVRTAIYAQAVFTLVQPLIAGSDGYIDELELKSLHQLYLGILLPGCALLFAAIIQTKTFGLSVFHGVIVLNLSWINNTSALIFFEFALFSQWRLEGELSIKEVVRDILKEVYKVFESDLTGKSGESRSVNLTLAIERVNKTREVLEMAQTNPNVKSLGTEDVLKEITQGLTILEGLVTGLRVLIEKTESTDDRDIGFVSQTISDLIERDKNRFLRSLQVAKDHSTKRGKLRSLIQKVWIMAVLASIHLTLFATFGAWLWITVDKFGSDVDCEISTHLIIFGAAIPVVSPALRTMSLLVYVLCILPLINIIMCVALGFVAVHALHRVITCRRRRQGSLTTLSDRYFFHSAVFFTFLSQLYFILCTEFTIKNNQHLLVLGDSRENDWTFGQTLAVALTAIPLLEVVKSLGKVARKTS